MKNFLNFKYFCIIPSSWEGLEILHIECITAKNKKKLFPKMKIHTKIIFWGSSNLSKILGIPQKCLKFKNFFTGGFRNAAPWMYYSQKLKKNSWKNIISKINKHQNWKSTQKLSFEVHLDPGNSTKMLEIQKFFHRGV